ncbi:MAG: hypothetical protein ACRC4L_00110 [Mycoplasma sp.]
MENYKIKFTKKVEKDIAKAKFDKNKINITDGNIKRIKSSKRKMFVYRKGDWRFIFEIISNMIIIINFEKRDKVYKHNNLNY